MILDRRGFASHDIFLVFPDVSWPTARGKENLAFWTRVKRNELAKHGTTPSVTAPAMY